MPTKTASKARKVFILVPIEVTIDEEGEAEVVRSPDDADVEAFLIPGREFKTRAAAHKFMETSK